MSQYQGTQILYPLSKVLIGRALNEKRFLATQMCAKEATDKDDGIYFEYDKDRNHDRINDLLRLEGAEASEIKSSYSSKTYKSKTIAVKNFIDAKYIRNAAEPIKMNHRKGMSINLTKTLLKAREYDLNTILANPANYASGNVITKSGTGLWSDFVNSDPYTDIATIIEAVLKSAEEQATFFKTSQRVWNVLVKHPKVLALLNKKDQDFIVDPARFMNLFNTRENAGIKDFYIGDTVYNAAKQGAPKNMQYIHGDYFVVGYENPDAGELYQETFLKMFYPRDTSAMQVETYQVPTVKGETVEVNSTYAIELLSGDAGGLVNTVL
jgi:hypothetical protein